MWLEYELLSNPEAEGVFCLSTSYRNEPDPVPGRHDKIFPMFEFEMKGGLDKLLELEKELLDFLGFGEKESFPEGNYNDLSKEYGVQELEHEHEEQLRKDHGPVYFIKMFPEHTSPFWNMKINEEDKTLSNKVDVILHGMETIGSAERATNKEEMRKQF